jgi:hypothetical protein
MACSARRGRTLPFVNLRWLLHPQDPARDLYELFSSARDASRREVNYTTFQKQVASQHLFLTANKDEASATLSSVLRLPSSPRCSLHLLWRNDGAYIKWRQGRAFDWAIHAKDAVVRCVHSLVGTRADRLPGPVCVPIATALAPQAKPSKVWSAMSPQGTGLRPRPCHLLSTT